MIFQVTAAEEVQQLNYIQIDVAWFLPKIARVDQNRQNF